MIYGERLDSLILFFKGKLTPNEDSLTEVHDCIPIFEVNSVEHY